VIDSVASSTNIDTPPELPGRHFGTYTPPHTPRSLAGRHHPRLDHLGHGQDHIVIAVTRRRDHRPAGVVTIASPPSQLLEGQPVNTAVTADGQVRCWRPASGSLGLTAVAFIGAAQLATLGVIAVLLSG
jgi:hypothetical protein